MDSVKRRTILKLLAAVLVAPIEALRSIMPAREPTAELVIEYIAHWWRTVGPTGNCSTNIRYAMPTIGQAMETRNYRGYGRFTLGPGAYIDISPCGVKVELHSDDVWLESRQPETIDETERSQYTVDWLLPKVLKT